MYSACSFSSEHIIEEPITVHDFGSVLKTQKLNGKERLKWIRKIFFAVSNSTYRIVLLEYPEL